MISSEEVSLNKCLELGPKDCFGSTSTQIGSVAAGDTSPSTKHPSTEATGASFPISSVSSITPGPQLDAFTVEVARVYIKSMQITCCTKFYYAPADRGCSRTTRILINNTTTSQMPGYDVSFPSLNTRLRLGHIDLSNWVPPNVGCI